MMNNEAFFEEMYFVPWARAGPYLVGVLVGMYYWEYKSSIREPTLLRELGA